MPERNVHNIVQYCTNFLNYHYAVSPKTVLTELGDAIDDELQVGRYGSGALITDFEAELAELLGKPAAIFMPTGTMSQQIALRIWSERKNNRTVVFHPLSHLEIHENMAYRELHGLNGMPTGSRSGLLTLENLQAIKFPFKTLLIELPQREIGGVLPTWEELTAIIDWAHEQGIAIHLDGARLWEVKPFYGRDYAEIAGLFDSVYVSFYKILEGIAGAALLGDEDFINEARIWRHRHGGNIFGMYPMVLTAKRGMEKHLPRMGAYHQRACEVAEILTTIPKIEIMPNPPHTNMMHVYFQGTRDKIWDAALDVAEEMGIWLIHGLQPAPIPNYARTEMVMGNASLDIDLGELETAFHKLMDYAKVK